MKLYAETTGRQLAQLAGDAVAIAWTIVAIRLALAVRDQLAGFAAPGRDLEQAGNGLRDQAAGVRGQVSDLPGVGDALGGPFDAIADTGGSIAELGRAQQAAVLNLATVVAVVIVALALVVVVVWIAVRVRWMVRATRARRLATTPAGQSLLALSALTRRSFRTLLSVAPDPAGAWRTADPEVVRNLATLELRALGLRDAGPLASPQRR